MKDKIKYHLYYRFFIPMLLLCPIPFIHKFGYKLLAKQFEAVINECLVNYKKIMADENIAKYPFAQSLLAIGSLLPIVGIFCYLNRTVFRNINQPKERQCQKENG